jgi:glycosyltransferase involved in cell wall biosynthesis
MSKKQNTLISCIIPTYNRANKVGRAVESILNQTYSNLELLVVDDQSSDNTKAIISKLAKHDIRVKYFLNPKKGANNARNYGIINAKGKYIAFLDDDDVWIESKIEKQVAVFEELEDKYGVVYCQFAKVKDNGKIKKKHPSSFSSIKNGDILNRLLKRNFIGTPTIVVKAEVFKKSGMFNPDFKSFQDWELLTRIARNYHFFYIKEVLVKVNQSANSITLDKKGRVITSIMHLKQNIDIYKNNPQLLSKRYCSLGVTLLKLKKHNYSNWLFFKSIKQNPLNIEAYLFLLLLKVKSIFN